MSVIKHVTLNRSDDWSIDAPLYTSQLDIIVARRLDTRGLHLESDDTPKQLKARLKNTTYRKYSNKRRRYC